jgi:hypothetical protein
MIHGFKHYMRRIVMEELWKEIPGYEKYSVSNTGKIRGPRRTIVPFISNCGYEIISMSVKGGNVKKSVHRLVAEAFIENPDNKTTVDHINRIRTDNRVENLRWATPSENNTNTMCKTRELFGLRWHKRGAGYYEIRFGPKGNEKSYGTALTLEEAKQKRDAALKQTECIPI